MKKTAKRATKTRRKARAQRLGPPESLADMGQRLVTLGTALQDPTVEMGDLGMEARIRITPVDAGVDA